MTNGGVSELVLAQDDFERVLQAGVGQRGELGQVLLEVGQAQDVAQADAHELGLVIAAQPEALVRVAEAVAQVRQDFCGGLALAQPTAR